MVMLYGLSRVAGFEELHSKLDDVLDAFAAYAVAAIVSLAVLLLLGVISADTPLHEVAGKVAIQAVPASFGAMIGAKLMGEGDEIEEQERWRETYQGQLFLMAAGALFLSFTMAPTEEMILISFQMTPWHALAVVLLSILLLHAIIHLVGFPGQESREGTSARSDWLTHSLPGYGIAVLVSLYVLWTFGRTAGLDLPHIVMAVAVLAFPAVGRRRHRPGGGMIAARKKPRDGIPPLEWAAAALGLLIAAGDDRRRSCSRACAATDDPVPLLAVTAETVTPAAQNYVVTVRLTNDSGRTAAAVQVEGVLKRGEEEVETSIATVDYVPGHSEAKGGLVFTEDPRAHQLELRVTGYEHP